MSTNEKVKETAEVIESKEATGDKREEAVVNEEIQKANDKKGCITEISEILAKYNCELKAQLTINEAGTVSQVFIVNK